MPGKSIARQQREAQLDEAQRISGTATEGKYHAGFDKRAHDYALLGATNEQIAQMLEVSPASVSRWMIDQPTFRKAIQKARVDAGVKVVKSLHRAANGFKAKESKVFNVNGELQVVDVIKQFAPDTTAANMILTNRMPEHWKDRSKVSAGAIEGISDLLAACEEVAQARAAKLAGERAKVIEGAAKDDADQDTP